MPTTVRDKLWLWGHPSGSHNKRYGIPHRSTIAPADAAADLGLRNLIMVEFDGQPAPPLMPYAAALQPLERIVWSVAVAGRGEVEDLWRNVEDVLALGKRFRNIQGAICDDLFCHGPDRRQSRISLDDLLHCRNALHNAPFPIDLWSVVYDYQLQANVAQHLALCDAVTFWTWKAEHLDRLDANLAQLEDLVPAPRKILGCYMWDYGGRAPMPAAAMRRQCDRALEWLKSGRIDGVIFLASCVCDLPVDAVAIARSFIEKSGDTVLE